MMLWTTPETGEKIVDIAASISKYAKENIGNSPMTANYSGKQPTLLTLDEIAAAIDDCTEKVKDLPGHPGDYLRAMLNSHKHLVRWLAGDKTLSYLETVKNVLEVELKPVPPENFKVLEARMDKQLDDWGYKGTFVEKLNKWQDEKTLPEDQVLDVVKKYIARTREKTVKMVRWLPDDSIESVNGIKGVHFSGRSEYLGDYVGRLTFNVERPWTDPGFACVLTHEAYPGHHAYYVLWDYKFKEGTLPLEASYYLVGSPVSCLFEGAPECGVRYIGWDDPGQDTPELSAFEKQEIIFAKDLKDLVRMYQTQGSYMYNVEGKSQEETIAYMRSNGWYSEIEARNTFRFFSGKYSCISYTCYYYGRWILQAAYDAWPKDRLDEFYHLTYDIPQTNSTLIKAVEKVTGKPFDPFKGI